MNQEKLTYLIEAVDTMLFGMIAINGYTNKDNEKSNRRINIGFSYEKAKKADLDTLNEGVQFIPSEKYTKADWDMAIVELKQSLIAPNEVKSQAQSNAYIALTKNGVVHYNFNTKEVYIWGVELKGSKDVIEQGDKKPVKSAPKTIAKNKIKAEYLKTGLIRRHKVNEISQLKLKGDVIEIDE